MSASLRSGSRRRQNGEKHPGTQAVKNCADITCMLDRRHYVLHSHAHGSGRLQIVLVCVFRPGAGIRQQSSAIHLHFFQPGDDSVLLFSQQLIRYGRGVHGQSL